MKYLLDTHTLLWILADDRRLSETVKTIYLNSNNIIFFSLACTWELAIKVSLKKLKLTSSLETFVEKHIIDNNIKLMNIEPEHLYLLENLPFFHRDPFDRLLIAQSIYENIPIVGCDTTFDLYPVKRVW